MIVNVMLIETKIVCIIYYFLDVLIAIALVIWSLFQTEAVRNNKDYSIYLEIFAAVLFFLSEIVLYLPINAPEPVVYPAMPQTVSYITTQQQSYRNW